MFLFFTAGAISSAIATPTDVLKVRMQVHGRGTDKIGLIGCFREIYHYEGISGLWRVRYIERFFLFFDSINNIFFLFFLQGLGPTAQRGLTIFLIEI